MEKRALAMLLRSQVNVVRQVRQVLKDGALSQAESSLEEALQRLVKGPGCDACLQSGLQQWSEDYEVATMTGLINPASLVEGCHVCRTEKL